MKFSYCMHVHKMKTKENCKFEKIDVGMLKLAKNTTPIYMHNFYHGTNIWNVSML